MRRRLRLSHGEEARIKRIADILRLARARSPQKADDYQANRDSLGGIKAGIRWPKISIVTPTYNQGGYIEDTILSIINQGYPNLEYIVMDGGSTDETHQVVSKYMSSITIYVSEKDKGQSNAINKGMGLATGEILYWLNSDDIMEPETLLYVGLRYLQEGFDLLTGCCTPFDQETGRLLNRHIATCPYGMRTEDITDIERTWLKGMYFHQPEVFFSRRLWEAAGAFVDEDLYYSMDYDLWVRMAVASNHNTKVLKAGKNFCLYRCHSNQKTSTTEVYLPELLEHSLKLRRKYTGRSLIKRGAETEPRQRLSIAAISDFGFNGGAGIAHKRICQVLQAACHDVMQLSGFQRWQSETLEVDISGVIEALDILQPDLVVLGNLHNLRFGLDVAEACTKRFPVIAIAHDFWWITGRCAYMNSCQYFHAHCDASCPTHNEYPRLGRDEIREAHQRKKQLLMNPSFYLLANSDNTQARYQEAINSWGIRSNPIGKLCLPIVREGVDILSMPTRNTEKTFYFPKSQSIRIVYGCTDHSDFRKGTDLGIRVLKSLLAEDPLIHIEIYGRNGHLLSDRIDKYSDRVTLHGYIGSKLHYEELLSDCDMFIGFPREETLGQTFVEAAHAGLVTVGPLGTGYSDVVSACNFSYGFRNAVPNEILATIKEACRVIRKYDRTTLRAIQRSQAQASFSGMSCLSSFYDYLHISGLANKLNFMSPTKIYDLGYKNVEVSELTLCCAATDLPESQEDSENTTACQDVIVPISQWKLGPGLHLENADGVPIAWLKAQTQFLAVLPRPMVCSQITLNCHWIPEAMRQSTCTLTICGVGTWTVSIPANGNIVNFVGGNVSSLIRVTDKLLCSLRFHHAICLDDGRSELAVVGKSLDLNMKQMT